MHKKNFFIIFLCTSNLTQTSFRYTPEIVHLREANHRSQEKFENENFSTFSTVSPESMKRIEPKHIITEQEKAEKIETKKLEDELANSTKLIGNVKKTNFREDITLKDNKTEQETPTNSVFEKINQKAQKNIDQIKSSVKESSINLKNSIIQIPDYVSDQFNNLINKMTFAILKKSIFISPHSPTSQLTFTDMIAASLRKYLFIFLQLPNKINTKTKVGKALNDFKMEIQFLIEQINSYNGKKYYTNPDQMLTLIKIINTFIKESHTQNIPFIIEKKLVTINTQATICCNTFKNQNIIFSTENTPKEILLFFAKSIQNTNNLTDIQYSYNIINTIYDDEGYIDKILETWSKYQHSELYKNKINREYGAFITFLLIFDNSIIAAANILEQTSALYKLVNPMPVNFNINTN